jgi:hypothetical protein
MTTLTLKAKAWLSDSYGPDDLKADNDRAVSALSIFAPCHGNMGTLGYCLVGDATITIESVDEKTLVENKVDALKAEKAKVLGDAYARATELESKIQKLLAITYEPA